MLSTCFPDWFWPYLSEASVSFNIFKTLNSEGLSPLSYLTPLLEIPILDTMLSFLQHISWNTYALQLCKCFYQFANLALSETDPSVILYKML